MDLPTTCRLSAGAIVPCAAAGWLATADSSKRSRLRRMTIHGVDWSINQIIRIRAEHRVVERRIA